jgi:hypothetical protein
MLNKFLKIFLILHFSFFTFHFSLSQINLVPNPSFEFYNTCPVGDDFHNVQNWFNPSTSASPDIFDTCAIDVTNNYGVPINGEGYQIAIDGESYGGLVVYYDSQFVYREYIGIKLNSTLLLGTKYYVSFYVNLADSSREACDQIGCFFSTDTIRNNGLPLNLNPQVANSNFNYLSSKQNWKKISGSFIADSAYKFLTIGNFKDSAQTHVIYVTGGINQLNNKYSYYYIDYVCVSTDSLTCNSLASIKEIKNDTSVVIFPNPANENFIIKVNEPALLSIYNNIGVKIIEQKLSVGNNLISTLNFNSTIYFLEIRIDNYQIIKQKIIINH